MVTPPPSGVLVDAGTQLARGAPVVCNAMDGESSDEDGFWEELRISSYLFDALPRTCSRTCTLDTMPDDVFLSVAAFCSWRDILALGTTSIDARFMCSNPLMWKLWYCKRFEFSLKTLDTDTAKQLASLWTGWRQCTVSRLRAEAEACQLAIQQRAIHAGLVSPCSAKLRPNTDVDCRTAKVNAPAQPLCAMRLAAH